MSKRDFYLLFHTAWHASFKETTILWAFEATGLLPFNLQRVLQRFTAEASGNNSDLSRLSASDWMKIERLMRRVVTDQGDRQVKKLSQVLHTNSVQNALLKHKVHQLQEALKHKKKRRRQGKALPLQEPEETHEEEQQQHQKLQAAQRRKEAKQAKAEAVQQRRQARAGARVLREKLKANQVANQAMRQAARRTASRLYKAVQLSQKG
ncbi:hypothetical protein EJ02DRAFT_425853 [Clathrospora elynae]|uniref:Uncharacterized protein n=1 Tax=Clathrospora elynae TaxID=706981 RepID=A0A6A5SCH3_9PLEO|nr:hypothetical protein EJ02DRAFT_425853 [Clathrospora elynae]